MKLHFKTANPKKLKSDILSLIDNVLKTWEIHKSANEIYIKHTQQWGHKGVIKMEVDENEQQLIVLVLKFENTEENLEDFEGYYLGRFCEIIFVNFPSNFTSIVKL